MRKKYRKARDEVPRNQEIPISYFYKSPKNKPRGMSVAEWKKQVKEHERVWKKNIQLLSQIENADDIITTQRRRNGQQSFDNDANSRRKRKRKEINLQ